MSIMAYIASNREKLLEKINKGEEHEMSSLFLRYNQAIQLLEEHPRNDKRIFTENEKDVKTYNKGVK